MEIAILRGRRWIRWGAALGCALFLVWTGLPLKAEIQAIMLYQRFASPLAATVVTCRFQPTCSNYALQQLRTRGFWIGNAKIAVRLALCSPLGALIDYVRDDDTPLLMSDPLLLAGFSLACGSGACDGAFVFTRPGIPPGLARPVASLHSR